MAHDQIDAQRFERATERARALLNGSDDADRAAFVLGEALSLWRGQALGDVEEWGPGRIEAGRLDELHREAEELYVEASLRSGHSEKVLARAQTLVHEQPLRERRWALLALAQYQAGQQNEALITLRRVRKVFNRDLGVDPGPELAQLEQAMLRQDPALFEHAPLPEPSAVCPYRGLLPYDTDNADTFFGRSDDVDACLQHLSATRVLAVVGPSGSGKSSMVRAGVVAALRRDGLDVMVLTPGRHPTEAIAMLPRRRASTILVVDQCEEVWSLCDDVAERERFLDALVEQAETGSLVVAIRADHLVDVSEHRGFAGVVARGLHLISGMREAELRAAIVEPARLAGLEVEPALVEILVREVSGNPGALPMLSHALQETWQRREGRTLTVAGYEASGGIREAVARSAEQVYSGVATDQQPLLRALLLRLVAPSPEGDPVRTRMPRRLVVTDPAHDQMIDVLVGSRLVTSDEGVVEIAHEALAREWPRLRDWLEEDVEGQRDPAPSRLRCRLVGRPRPPGQRALPGCAAGQGTRLARPDDPEPQRPRTGVPGRQRAPGPGRAPQRAGPRPPPGAGQPPAARRARGRRRTHPGHHGRRRLRTAPDPQGRDGRRRRPNMPPWPSRRVASAPVHCSRPTSASRCCSPSRACAWTTRPRRGSTCTPRWPANLAWCGPFLPPATTSTPCR